MSKKLLLKTRPGEYGKMFLLKDPSQNPSYKDYGYNLIVEVYSEIEEDEHYYNIGHLGTASNVDFDFLTMGEYWKDKNIYDEDDCDMADNAFTIFPFRIRKQSWRKDLRDYNLPHSVEDCIASRIKILVGTEELPCN